MINNQFKTIFEYRVTINILKIFQYIYIIMDIKKPFILFSDRFRKMLIGKMINYERNLKIIYIFFLFCLLVTERKNLSDTSSLYEHTHLYISYSKNLKSGKGSGKVSSAVC